MVGWIARDRQREGFGPRLRAALFLLGTVGLAAVLWPGPPRPTYSITIDELLLYTRDYAPGDLVRVQGLLVPGSLVRQEVPPCSAEFRVKGEKREILVGLATCSLPDALCNQPSGPREVAIEGRLDPLTHRLEATAVLVKQFGGRYEMLEGPDGKLIGRPLCL